MKKCLACSATFSSSDSCCLVCGSGPEMQEGFLAYAPALAQGGGGFKAAYFTDLARLEAGHFWFRARNRLIIWALGKYCPEFRSFLEIGCGTGYVLSGIANAYPGAQLHGSEIFTAGLAFAAARQPTIDFMQMDGRCIPFAEEFDAIGAFDVLEHIEEDEQVLRQMHGALKSGGVILLTVPQHAWLWSPVDDYACHIRRYSAKRFMQKSKVQALRFCAAHHLYLVCYRPCLPPAWCKRYQQKNTRTPPLSLGYPLGLMVYSKRCWMPSLP